MQSPIFSEPSTIPWRWILATLLVGLLASYPATARSAAPETPLIHSIPPSAFRVPESKGWKTQVLSAGKIFSLSGGDPEQTVSINIGSLQVKPGVFYRASFRVESKAGQQASGVSLMIREHPEIGAPATQPYHRTAVGSRPLANGASSLRELSFVSGENTHALSIAIVVTGLVGELHFAPCQLYLGTPTGKPLSSEQAAADFAQLMARIRTAAETRKPLTPRPLVFSRSQMKYPLGRNYYHEWNDRPLLVDRKYRVPSPYPTPLPSYQRTLEELRQYDIDGLAFFPETSGRMRMFEAHREARVEGVGLLPEFLPSNDIEAIAQKIEILKIAGKLPAVPRIDGKVLVTSYAAESLSPEQWGKLLATLRREVGDTFLFLPSLANAGQLRKPLMDSGSISRAEVEQQQDTLRKYLDVCDGIYFHYPAAFRLKDHSFDSEFYRDIFIPVFKSVLAEPAYQKKYLGLSAYRSHMSPERGNSLHEDGTRTLRLSFEAAMEARPDVIILPEWDEQNENTSFRPTVDGSRATERILRYYMSRIKGKEPTPVPGDDVTIPNLILSSRKAVTLGEQALFEILNVPDSCAEGHYQVELKLEDPQGQVVHAFPLMEFNAAQLEQQRFYLTTETLPQTPALVPTLRVRAYKGRDIDYDHGFHHLAVRATWNWDHLFVKQPLRDLLCPDKASISWGKTVGEGDGAPQILSGSIAAPEALSLVEVLGDDDEVYAVDPCDEFFRNDPTRELLLIEFRSINNQKIAGTLTLKNATANWFGNGPPFQQQAAEPEGKSQQIDLTRPVSVHQRWIYLAIPREDLASGELSFELDRGNFTIPLREVFARKMVAKGFDGGIHLSIKAYRRQIDMPVSLNARESHFSVRIWPEISTEQYHLRLTSVSGKTYRSRPLLLPQSNSAQQKTLRIYSAAQQQAMDIAVAGGRIPMLQFEFTPERGAVLLTDAGRPFWATLGGFSNSTTGRGTVNGLFGDRYPTQVKRSDPQWVEDEGRPCLEFDGKGTYLELPREALPWRGAFTLSFDVKPKTAQDQNLLINGAVTRQHGLAVEIKGGKLYASFADADWQSHRWQTELPVPPGVWSAIRIGTNFETITLSVDGKTQSFPLTRPASNIGFTVFGAAWKGQPFEGRLRGLKIEHNHVP